MIIGLTGGIACGKSAVGAILRQLGATIIDADVVAREVVLPGTPSMMEIEEAFGPSVLTNDGRLDRAKMGELILEDSTAKATLERITHPAIRTAIAKQTRAAMAAGAQAVVVEAALLIETGGYRGYPILWLVACTRDRQVARLMARQACSREVAERWIDAQMPLEAKRAHATTVIENNGSRADLRKTVEAAYCALMGQRLDPD